MPVTRSDHAGNTPETPSGQSTSAKPSSPARRPQMVLQCVTLGVQPPLKVSPAPSSWFRYRATTAATKFDDLEDEQVLAHASTEQIDAIRESSVKLLQVIEQNGKAIEKAFEGWKPIAQEIAAYSTSIFERRHSRKLLERMDWFNSATQLFISQTGRLLQPQPIDQA